MRWGKKLATGTLATMMAATATGLITAAPAEAAGTKYKCKASATLDWGRPKATSACSKSGSGKAIKQHRVVLVCDVLRGTGAGMEHTIPWTLRGDWKKPGEKSTVMCGMRSFLRSYKAETR
ncbi:hypothetical protein OG735_16910 [Streptomyces sp. NBC_01210]|uniref:hypothetical protein n=1 Tax=Streptomyces sp. NBC_01210 TaxID=2903774 RepID=UPI002E0D7E0E|nr:hypothetical protein OG735_16910 [Streptomyces sp. NBC_01210]